MREDVWIQSATGRKLYPFAPKAADVCLEDIAQALSNIPRFGGHTVQFYSVAQHSYLMSKVVYRQQPFNHLLQLHALLHDAGEYMLLDIPTPVKRVLDGYAEAERRVEAAIYEGLGIPPMDDISRKLIKELDRRIVVDESRALLAKPELEEGRITGEPLNVAISDQAPGAMKHIFMAAANVLLKEVKAKPVRA